MCTCPNMLYFKKESRFTMCGAEAEIYPATGLGISVEGGGLLDLSCQPFTHNVSFMNVSCADLIPFRAE